jgi:citronellyl-CoA synthetase
MSAPVTKNIDHQRILKFSEVFPRILALIPRLPKIAKALKGALSLTDEDKISIGGVIEEIAVTFKDRTALLFEEKSWTYQEFNQETNRLAHYLLSRGVKKGDNIVSFLNNRPELLFTLSAAAKIGARVSLINFNLRKKVLSHCVNIMPASIYVVDEELVDAFEEIRADLPESAEENLYFYADSGSRKAPEGYHDLKQGADSESDQNPSTTKNIILGDGLCYIFTSGTTGFPKAAPQFHRSMYRAAGFVGTVVLDIKKEDRVYVTLPFFHSVGVKLSWMSTFMKGATLIMRRKFSVSSFWDDIRKYRANTFFYIGELCSYLINQPEKENDGDNPIQKILGNGLRPEIWKQFKNRFKIPKIMEFYGASESNGSMFNILNLDETVGMALESHAVVEYDIEEAVFVRDEDGFVIKTPKGGAGMLLFELPAGKDQFTGYTDPKENEKKILSDVLAKGDRWFNTGDIMRVMGFNHYQFADRVGDTFRWKGENVATHEVEETVNAFQQVAESTTYGITMTGSDGRLGMTSVIPFCPFEEFDFAGFAAHVIKALPAYAVPRFLRLKTEFETTATHKIKKVELQQEGFDLKIVTDPLYVLIPGRDAFAPLTDELHAEIVAGKYSF